jgi:hypothetical protein
MAEKLLISDVKFAFANVFEPVAQNDGKGPSKYSVTLLIPKTNTAEVKKINDYVEKVVKENLAVWNNKRPVGFKHPLRDGDEERDPEAYPDFVGHYFINVSTKMQPGVIDANRQEIIDAREFYSGCFGRALVTSYAYNKEGNKGVGFGLAAVQKLQDGDRPEGSSWSADDFGDDDIL